jgi:hypothetical protein
MKAIKHFFVFYWNSLLNYINYYYLRHQANVLHKRTGKQYFIVPENKTKMMIVNNDFMRIYNKGSQKKITYQELCRMAYYTTGRGVLKTGSVHGKI